MSSASSCSFGSTWRHCFLDVVCIFFCCVQTHGTFDAGPVWVSGAPSKNRAPADCGPTLCSSAEKQQTTSLNPVWPSLALRAASIFRGVNPPRCWKHASQTYGPMGCTRITLPCCRFRVPPQGTLLVFPFFAIVLNPVSRWHQEIRQNNVREKK